MDTSIRFCPECGTKLEQKFAFCPECGAKVAELFQESNDTNDSSQSTSNILQDSTPTESVSTVPIQARGFILTNIQSLAKRLYVNPTDIQQLLQSYIHALRELGIAYQLIDASHYTYKKKPLFGAPKQVSLTPQDPWYAYADLLKDMHDDEVKAQQPESDYLFIIGGDNEVPMPCMPNYTQNNDKYFDTDLLYAYPYGVEMERKLMSQEIFKYDALFYIGRLPIAEDGTLADLRNYLQRVVENQCTVDLNAAYTQCDPHWRNVTMEITDNIAQHDLYPSIQVNLPQDTYYQQRIFTTPHVLVHPESKEQFPNVFNPYANFYFFNMHGGGEKTLSGFYGAGLDGGGCLEGFSPRQIAQAQQPNIIFTQACYGGKFIGYSKRNSMVLSAINTNTLAYVGSSRIAYGAIDSNRICLSTSDVLAKTFNAHVLRGCTVGAAFFQARVQTYKNRPGCPLHALTIGEFNLYGDPLIHFANDTSTYKLTTSKAAIVGANEWVGIVADETLMDKSADNAPTSLLQQVRQAVDKNIMDISATIAQTLYQQYGIPAREPAIISRRTYADGRKELAFCYHMPADNQITNEVVAIASERGELQTVMATK